MELLSNEEMVHFKTVRSVFFIDYLEIQEHSFWKEILILFCFFKSVSSTNKIQFTSVVLRWRQKAGQTKTVCVERCIHLLSSFGN